MGCLGVALRFKVRCSGRFLMVYSVYEGFRGFGEISGFEFASNGSRVRKAVRGFRQETGLFGNTMTGNRQSLSSKAHPRGLGS